MTTYRDAGVDIEKKNVLLKKIKEHVSGTFDSRVIRSETLFKGLLFHAGGIAMLKDPVLAFNTDGVGTKTLIAAELNMWDGIGADIVNHCINDVLTMGAVPLCFSDYVASAKLDDAIIERIVSGVAACCKENNIVFVGGETAEMPGVYHENAVDVAGFILGACERKDVVDGKDCSEGDVLIGITSSGLHSNGYSLVRALLQRKTLNINEVGEALLEPHRNYLATTLAVRKNHRIKAIAHITGGSFKKNMPRVLPAGLAAKIDRGSWDVPDIFQKIMSAGKIAEDEMYTTFNMGVGYVYVVDAQDADAVLKTLASLGENAAIIGKIVPHENH